MKTKHFNPEIDTKMVCTCCGRGALDDTLLVVLELVRNHFGEPVTITSGYRCDEYNAKVGGGEYSQHLYGSAADIVVRNISAQEVYSFIDKTFPNSFGLGLYLTDGGFVHIDVRPKRARW